MIHKIGSSTPPVKTVAHSDMSTHAGHKDTAKHMAFGQFLKSLNYELDKRPQRKGLSCFISYAWEEDKQENKALQAQLGQLRENLLTLKLEVKLDINDMNGHMETYMKDTIDRSDFILLIGTPRFKERSSDANTSLGLELEAALKKPPSALVPLWFKGSKRADAFPARIAENLIRDFRNQDNYFNIMTQVDSPIGLIPSLLGLHNDHDYAQLVNTFKYELVLINTNHLSVKELNRHNQQLEATIPTNLGNWPTQHVIETTLGENIKLDDQACFNISGMVVEGVRIELKKATDAEVQGIHRDLQNTIDARKITTGLKNVTGAKNVKVDASNTKATGVSFKYKFAPHADIVSVVERSSSTTLKPLTTAERELKAAVQHKLDQDYPETDGAVRQYRSGILATLAQFTDNTPVLSRKSLRVVLQEILEQLNKD